MCFHAKVYHTERLYQRLKKNPSKNIFYKIVNYGRVSPTMRSGLVYNAYKTVQARTESGLLKKTVNRVTKRDRQMTSGIYVYKNADYAIKQCHLWGQGNKVLLVQAKAEDLIGADKLMACFKEVKVLC